MSRVRGLPWRRPLVRRAVHQGDAREHLEAQLRAARSAADREADAKLLVGLGLAQASSADDPATEAATAPLGTFYDAGAKVLAVADWLGIDEQRPRLAHEIVHALQDQRWDLERVMRGARGETDRTLARLALVEGDAAVATVELMDASGALGGPRALPELVTALERAGASEGEGAPVAFLRQGRRFALVDGVAFVLEVRRRESWSGVDALWARPPESTEQVLHPDKYAAHEAPVVIEAEPAAPLCHDRRAERTDTMGELGLRAFLAQANPPAVAERAAGGWAGDRAVLCASARRPAGAAAGDEPPAIAWLTAWDSPADAADFAEAARSALDARPAVDGRISDLERRGSLVAIVIGAPRAHVDAALRETLRWKVGGVRSDAGAAAPRGRGPRAVPAAAKRAGPRRHP